MIAEVLRAVERFALPNVCVACDRSVPAARPDDLICDVCETRFRGVDPGCRRCGQPLPPVGPCRFCAPWTPALRRVSSAVWLGPEARALVHALKYRNGRRLADTAADAVCRRVDQPRDGLLVPVATTRGRMRRRGYNQAALIARALRARWDLPVLEGVLARRREAGSQTALTPEARLANVAGAFAAHPPAATPHGSRAILVDDVLTTGATLDAAARALAAAGWTRVEAVTFARALPYAERVAGT